MGNPHTHRDGCRRYNNRIVRREADVVRVECTLDFIDREAIRSFLDYHAKRESAPRTTCPVCQFETAIDSDEKCACVEPPTR